MFNCHLVLEIRLVNTVRQAEEYLTLNVEEKGK